MNKHETIVQVVKQQLTQKLLRKRFVCAYSGGVDSHVLLSIFSNLKNEIPELKLCALHINHDLHGDADDWDAHCENTANQFNIEYHSVKVNAQAESGQSPEEAARDARYQAFREFLQDDDCLVLAHHQDDQAETLLLQLARGAGVNGLAAMPKLTTFEQTQLWRPLLTCPRSQIESYARNSDLVWIEDSSNACLDYDRNLVRHKLLPEFKKRWPSITKTISRSATNCAQAANLLDDLAEIDLGERQEYLELEKINTLSENRRYNLWRYWIKSLGLPLPSEVKLHELDQQMLNAKADSTPVVSWDDAEVRRFKNKFYVMKPLTKLQKGLEFEWDGARDLVLPHNLGILTPELANDLGKDVGISVRFRQGGETCKIKNREGHLTLKNLFQEWQVPPWMRDRIPLLYVNNNLKMVVGYCLCE